VADGAPHSRRHQIAEAGQLDAADHVVETETDVQAAIRGAGDLADHQRVGAAPAPLGMVDRLCLTGHAQTVAVDDIEQAATEQIRAHHFGRVLAGGAPGQEGRDRHRDAAGRPADDFDGHAGVDAAVHQSSEQHAGGNQQSYENGHQRFAC